MRIGIAALLHESNTFSSQPTTIERFREDLWLEGDEIRNRFIDAHHEISGFFAGLEEATLSGKIEVVPLMAARALPAGTIGTEALAILMDRWLARIDQAGPLDGLLLALHGAAVGELQPDVDGWILSCLRRRMGPNVPVIATIDPHGNLSAQMVRNSHALIAYRTNPHVDQRERGMEAARLIVGCLRRQVKPTMSAIMLPMAINIERQHTGESPLAPIYAWAAEQRCRPGILSSSIVLGFPYADVAKMGTAVLVISDDDVAQADRHVRELSEQLWNARSGLRGQLTDIDAALDECVRSPGGPIGLLDMGDNVGGGSSADGTTLIGAIKARGLGPAFACLYDPASSLECHRVGVGARIHIRAGGKTDLLHGPPLPLDVNVVSLHEGRFRETGVTHGGMTEFDQGGTAIVRTDDGIDLMLTSRRMVPFSLSQLTSHGIDPHRYRILICKGVHAPVAAYGPVCQSMIRVNTMGSTCADLAQLRYTNRRRPMFPWEADVQWNPASAEIIHAV